MRILHLSTFLQGAAGAAVRDLAIKQHEAGHTVAVITTRTGVAPYGNDPEQIRALEEAGLGVFAVDSLFRRDYAANLNVVAFIHRRLGPASFDIMHAHSPVASLAAIVAASGTSARVLQTMHRWGARKSTAQENMDLAVMRQLPLVVAGDSNTRGRLVGLGVSADRLLVVPHGVRPTIDPFADLDTADADLRQLRALRQAGRPVACAIGTVGPTENHRLLVDALSALPAAERPFCLVIGRGAVARLTLYARSRGVEGSIRFCGYKPNARRFAREADCLVVPGVDEGPSLPMIEAFCDRVPVIAPDTAALRQVTRDGAAGTLFAANQGPALARALRASFQMTAAAREAMRHSALEVYRARFTAAAMYEGYMVEYRRLVSGDAARSSRELAA